LFITFLNSIKQTENIDDFKAAEIRSENWKTTGEYTDPLAEYYHSHEAYENYPVVNISYKGAILFCEWLTNQYNENTKRKFNKVIFRLPSKEEWIIAAKGGDSNAIYPWKGTELKNKKGQYFCNFKNSEDRFCSVKGVKHTENADITTLSLSYFPNSYGLYNMSGNVSEMLAEEGFVIGGNWKDSEEHMKIETDSNYYKTESSMPTIGFRFFMDLIER
jgi:formylglycine-generating enzyme required for sulfatase activity